MTIPGLSSIVWQRIRKFLLCFNLVADVPTVTEEPTLTEEPAASQLDAVPNNTRAQTVVVGAVNFLPSEHDEGELTPKANSQSKARQRGITFSHGSYFLEEGKARGNSLPITLSPSPSPESSSKGFDYVQPIRLRSATLNPRIISREDLNDFTIPHTELKKTDVDLGKLDLKLYQLDVNDNTHESIDGNACDLSIGHFSCNLQVSPDEEKIVIHLRELEIRRKPTSMITGSVWQVKPIFLADLHKRSSISTSALNSPKMSAKFANAALIPEITFKNKILSWHQPIELHHKHKNLSNCCLNLTLFDEYRRHKDLGIGRATIDFSSVLPLTGEKLVTMNLLPFSEPCDFQHGKLVTSHTWNTFGCIYELGILSTVSLKSPRGVDGRDFFAKIIVIEGSQEQCTHRTNAVRAMPDLNFRQSFGIPVSVREIQDMSIVVELHERRSKIPMSNSCIGKVVFGPYMAKTESDDGCGVWEKAVTNPNTTWTSSNAICL